ncbi:substrate-binding domain-containing protein [Actinokineospora sp. G85]|uniref:substrate-binding domain-containing protein n=1 Tax=Actinokineospora sp. G85 TaxID=3406626 RepID=UPI003C75B1C4
MGRHSSGRGRLRPALRLVAVAAAVGLVAWTAVNVVPKWFAFTCDEPPTLAVTAAPDIAPLVELIGERVEERGRAGDEGSCYHVAVTAKDSAEVAESLAVSADGALPDVWVPESTMVLRRAQANGAFSGPVNGTSIASTPVVLAMTDETATSLGWPGKQPTWADVLATPAETAIGAPDPVRDPVGTAAVFGVRAIADTTPDPEGSLTASLRRLAEHTAPTARELYDRLPGAGSPDRPLAVIATTERDLLRHNAADSGYKVVAGYADPPVPSMDYPFTVLPSAAQDKRDLALRFAGRLLDESSVRALGDAGFRAADGDVLRDRSIDQRTSTEPAPRLDAPDTAAVDKLLNQWAGANRSSRTQVLLDVSGSMAEQVPGAGATRMQVTAKAAALGMTLFRPESKWGLWLFSTKLDGDRDHRELLPIGLVKDHLGAGAKEKVEAVEAVEGGATGLYDSVLAAYRSSRSNWEAGRINVVIVMTDGRNEDPGGISRSELLAELATLQDPNRPLPLVGVGIGPDVDEEELTAIAAATGGQAYTAADPAKISDVFYTALGKLLCLPPTCGAG